jgi:14-3-3 protein epsilon
MLTSPSNLSSKDLKYLVSICLSLELFEEAYSYVNDLVASRKGLLDEEERNLYMKSVKGKLNSFRNGWKTLIDFDNYEGEKIVIPKPLIEEKRKQLEDIIKQFCMETIHTIQNTLQIQVRDDDFSAEIFYLKLKADYYRYYGEIAPENEFEKYKEECRHCYEKAYSMCGEHLDYTSPLFLSVALNYSVFLYTLTDEVKLAFDKANDVYKQAILKLNPEQKVPEIENIIKSIEENLTIWKIELADFNN